MRICFKPYKRRDGSWMLYINNDRKVSVRVSPDGGFGSYSKRTKGQENLINEACKKFAEKALPFEGDLEKHQEKVLCGPYYLLVTDVCDLGGQKVTMDGGYVVRDGKYFPCGQWF